MLSTIAVADVPSCPVFETDALDGLLVGEVIGKLAFDSPIVQAARADLRGYNRTKTQIGAFSSIFERAFFLWPLNLTFGSLNSVFRPTILDNEEVDEEKRWGARSPEIDAAFTHIVGCFGSITEAVRTSRIALVDMYNNPVHPSVWRRRGIITIDLQTSDLYEVYLKTSDPYEVGSRPWLKDDPVNALLRSGLYLSVPVSVAATPGKIGSPSAMPVERSRLEDGSPPDPQSAKLLTGPAPQKGDAAKQIIRDGIRSGKFTISQLLAGTRGGYKQETVAELTGLSRTRAMEVAREVAEEPEFSDGHQAKERASGKR